jgi:hypothetical protein
MPLPELAAHAEEMTTALSRVRARRLRSALMGATSAAACMVAVAVLAAGGGVASDSLRPVDPVGRPTVTPVATAAASTPRVTPQKSSVATGGQAAEGGVAPTGPVVVPTSVLSPSPRPASSYTPPKRSGYRARPTMTRVYTQAEVSPSKGASSGRYCSAGEVGGPDDTWCTFVDAGYSSSGLFMQYNVCRSGVVSGPARLTFDLVKEADFAVRLGTRELWRWSAGQTFGRQPHSLTVDSSGSCYVWRVRWDGVLDNGQDIAAGTYTVVATSAAAQLRKATSSTVDVY